MKTGFNKAPGKIIMQGFCTKADLDSIAQHSRYKAIDFRDCTLKNLDCVLPLKKLGTVCFYGGHVADFSALTQIPTLSELFLNGINRPGDFAFISQLTQLKKLQLLYLSKLETFPELSANTQLTTIRLWDCKRLTDISLLAKIPNLESVHILGTPHVPADLEFLVKLANIKSVNATFGTIKANKLMDEMLQHYGKTKHG